MDSSFSYKEIKQMEEEGSISASFAKNLIEEIKLRILPFAASLGDERIHQLSEEKRIIMIKDCDLDNSSLRMSYDPLRQCHYVFIKEK